MSFLALEKKGEGKLQSISLVTRFYNRIKNKFKKTFFSYKIQIQNDF